MELSHLPYKKRTYEYYVGRAGLERVGKKKMELSCSRVVRRLTAALQPDETVIGGGNVTKVEMLPPRCRQGANANAFNGGFRLWANDSVVPPNVSSIRTRSKERFERAEERPPTHRVLA
jgi:polyphosphate glucokinase